ncbi:MAG: hypothetical protein PVI06_09715 [Desulfobacterales bacterium]|jgi:hypothetical protein
MNAHHVSDTHELGPRLGNWPLPGKILVTIIVMMMAIGFAGALGQIIVHDIIPTFWSEKSHLITYGKAANEPSSDRGDLTTGKGRGDLFGDITEEEKATAFYQTDEFIYALKFTHIHIFGMSAIFILIGAIVLFLGLSVKAQIWLIILPFVGVVLDLGSVWLKIYIHPAFFWLHIPGGMLFGVVFAVDAVLILWQLWRHQLVGKN